MNHLQHHQTNPYLYLGVQVPPGLLYYTQSEEVIRVTPTRNEIRGLLMSRNDIANHLMGREQYNKTKRTSSQSQNQPQPPPDDPNPSCSPETTPPFPDEYAMSTCARDRCDERTATITIANPVPFLPPTIDDEWSCTKCYNVDVCMLYRKVRSFRFNLDNPHRRNSLT